MKYLLLMLFVGTAMSVRLLRPADERVTLAGRLARAFNITEQDAEHCLNKFETTEEDLQELEGEIVGIVIGEQKGLRRASCTVVCCAQKNGLMVGAEIQYDLLHKRLNEGDAPEYVYTALQAAFERCKKQVEGKTDACVVGVEFMKCVVTSTQELMDVLGL